MTIHPLTNTKLVLFHGQKSVISRDFPLYKWAFENHGFIVEKTQVFRSNKKVSSFAQNNSDWFILMCLDFSDADTGLCSVKQNLLQLRLHQKVNRIPGIKKILGRKDAFCSTMNEARKISTVLLKHPLTPLCFIFPEQYQQFVHVAEGLGYNAEWVIKPVTVTDRIPGNGPQIVTLFTKEGNEKMNEYSTKRAVVQQLIPNPLLIYGFPTNLRVYLLITSIEPLRAFVHKEGFVFHRFDATKNYKKIAGRTWLLSHFWKFANKNYGEGTAKKAMLNIRNILVKTLLVTEAMLVTQSDFRDESINSVFNKWTINRCSSCFQLMAVDLMLNTNFDPFLLEVSNQPNMQEIAKEFTINRVKREILDDVVRLITSSDDVAADVSNALQEVLIENKIGVMGINCLISHEMCLSREDLAFLLQTRRETLNKGQFDKLYPEIGTEVHKELIEELSSKIIVNSVNDLSFHKTAHLHPLLMAIERLYNRHSIDTKKLTENLNHINVSTKDSTLFENNFKRFIDCSDDPSTLPFLASIELTPKLSLNPHFSPLINRYFANASYDQLLITIFAKTQNCQSEVRIDDKFGPSRPLNYSLGIGANKITFVIVDISQTEPFVISTYILYINRLHLTDNETKFNPLIPHQICALKQDCGFRVFSRDSCGLKVENRHNWRTHLKLREKLSKCSSGIAPGKWTLPCHDCDQQFTCYWSEARWEPDNCEHKKVDSEALSKCLANKKILFIGDSTNRGIMHYLIEKLNGSLTDNDKTHNTRIYEDLNGGKTLMGFTYYPKFWLPSNKRPSFDKTLSEILRRVQPLKNDTNVVIMFGGVQWLAIQHIHLLLTTLSNLKLKGVKLLMKSLGSGFHQTIEGVHCLSIEEQQKLSAHNTALSTYARMHGIEVIDTYNITVARYKDFYPGKCACHFHSIKDHSEAMASYATHPQYHVEGMVNAIYSEIFMSRLCK